MSHPGSQRQREAIPMKSDPLAKEARDLRADVLEGGLDADLTLPRRMGAWILHELRGALPPTIFFFIGFNFIILTTNLLVADYAVAVSNFMLATMAALVVGKAVITANAMPFLKLFDRAPLIQPILFKTAIYWIATFIARLGERFVHFSVVEGNRPGDFAVYLISDFSWQRFSAISLWILVLFLIYVTASEFSQLFGPAEMRRLLFAYRPSELQLNRRQRARELMRLNRLADEHEVDKFRDPASPAHQHLVEIVERLARAPRQRSASGQTEKATKAP
jgi:hypothetical protein